MANTVLRDRMGFLNETWAGSVTVFCDVLSKLVVVEAVNHEQHAYVYRDTWIQKSIKSSDRCMHYCS